MIVFDGKKTEIKVILEAGNGQWVGLLFYKERGHFDSLSRLDIPSQID
jgi:hypothetical protein